MKKLKNLALVVVILATTLNSCTDNNPIENQAVTTKSIAFRTALNQLKIDNNIASRSIILDEFCYQFVYPITVSYNNGTQATVSSFEGLLELLVSENQIVHLDGVSFPFQVVLSDGNLLDITNETEFNNLNASCSFDTINDYVFASECYELIYPLSVLNGEGETILVNNESELLNLLEQPNGNVNYQLDFVFPISVILNDETVVINSLYELFQLNNDCDPIDTCPCPANVDPVCVQTSNGLVQYNNACMAECDGYTVNDFVDCDTATGNTFDEQLGTCFDIDYPVQVDSQGNIVEVNSNDELLQYYDPAQSNVPLMVYPITVIFTGDNDFTVFDNQADFETAIDEHCN